MRHQASWVRYLSIFLLAGFVSQDISWAADLRVSFAGSGVQADWIRPLKTLSADAAVVEEVHEGRGPLIYLIRDAHTNPSAQFNLSKTLDHLIGSGELRWVFAEAGVGDNSLAPLKGLTSHDRIEAAARAWVRRGRMKGTEYLSVTSPRDFELQGIENPELYRESIRLYREVVKNRSGILAYLSRFMRTVQFLKNRYYSAELAEFDRSREACREDGSHAADCMAKLERAAQRLGLSQEPLSRLAALDQLKEREAAIDHDRLSREWAEWWKRSEDRRSERDFPEVHKYLVLQRQSQKVLTPELFEEAHDKELRVYAALARRPEAAGLVRADRQLRTIRRWVELEAEPRDGRDFEADPSMLDLVGIAAFLNRQLMDAGMDPGLAILLDRRLHPKIQSAIRFYQLTRLRDAYFMDQITSKIGDGSLKTAALITGGYHTDHLTRLFREKGWSYAVITPRVLEETDRARYERLLLNDFAPVSKAAGPGAFIASGASSRNHLDTPFMRRTGMGLPIPSTPAFEFAARELGLTETAAEEALKTGARLSADQQLKAYLQTLNGKAVVILDAAMPFRAPEQPAAESRPKPATPGDPEKELDAQVLSALEARPEGASAEDLWRTMSQASGAPDLEAVEKSLERWVLKKKIIFNTWPLGQREEKVYEAAVKTDEESAGDAETTEPAALPAADAEVDGRRFRPGAWTARQRSLGAALKSRVKALRVDLSQSKLIALKTLGLYREAIDPGVKPLKIGLVLSLNGLVVSGAASTADASVERLKYLDSDALLVAVGASEITDPGRAILRTLEFRNRKKQAQVRKAAGIKIQPPRSEDTQAARIRRRLEEDAGKVEKWLAERPGEKFTAADIAKGLHGDRKPSASETSRTAHAAKFLIRSGRPVRSVTVGIKIKKVRTRYTNAYMYIGEKSSGARLAERSNVRAKRILKYLAKRKAGFESNGEFGYGLSPKDLSADDRKWLATVFLHSIRRHMYSNEWESYDSNDNYLYRGERLRDALEIRGYFTSSHFYRLAARVLGKTPEQLRTGLSPLVDAFRMELSSLAEDMQSGTLIPRVIAPTFWESVLFRFGNESKQLVTKSINKAIERGIVGVAFPIAAMAISAQILQHNLFMISVAAVGWVFAYYATLPIRFYLEKKYFNRINFVENLYEKKIYDYLMRADLRSFDRDRVSYRERTRALIAGYAGRHEARKLRLERRLDETIRSHGSGSPEAEKVRRDWEQQSLDARRVSERLGYVLDRLVLRAFREKRWMPRNHRSRRKITQIIENAEFMHQHGASVEAVMMMCVKEVADNLNGEEMRLLEERMPEFFISAKSTDRPVSPEVAAAVYFERATALGLRRHRFARLRARLGDYVRTADQASLTQEDREAYRRTFVQGFETLLRTGKIAMNGSERLESAAVVDTIEAYLYSDLFRLAELKKKIDHAAPLTTPTYVQRVQAMPLLWQQMLVKVMRDHEKGAEIKVPTHVIARWIKLLEHEIQEGDLGDLNRHTYHFVDKTASDVTSSESPTPGARLAVAPQHYYPGNRRGDYWYGPIDQHRQDFLAEIKDRRMTHIKLGQILRMINSPTSKVTRLASWGHPTHPSSNLRYTQYLVENEVYDHTGGFWWMNKDKNSRFSMVVERDPQMGDDWGRLWVFRESSPLHEPILKMNWKSYQEKKTSGGDWNSYDLMDEDTNRDTLGDTVSILEAKADFRGARLANRVFEIELRNPRGIHMWPSQQISNLANWIYQDYLVAIRIHDLNTGSTADADDVQGLLELKAEKGAKLELTLTGSHESLGKVEAAVRKFFESGREEMESKITRQDYLRDILGSEAGARLAGALDLLEDEKKKTPEEYAPNSYLFRFGKNQQVSEIVSGRETRIQSLQHADAYEVETGDRMFAGEEDYDWRGMREVKQVSLQETNPSLDTGTAGTASCLSCGFMIVYNAASRETFYAHSYGTESLSSWTRTIEDAAQRFKGSEKDVVVYMGGNDFYDSLLQIDKYRELRAFLADGVPYPGGRRILKQLEAFVANRERLSQRAIGKGFRVVQAFPAYIGMNTTHTFDPESGTLLLEEELRSGVESLPRLTPEQLLQRLRLSAVSQAARLAEREKGGSREGKKGNPSRVHDDKEDQLLDEAMDIQEAMHDLEMLIRAYGEHVDTMLREIAGNKPPREQELEIFVFWAENSFVDYRRSLTYLINELEGMLRNLKNLPPQPEFETSLVQHRDDSMRLLEALNEKYRARMPIIEFYQKLIDTDREGRGARLSAAAVADFAAGIFRAQPAAWAAENPRMVPVEDGRARIALVRSNGAQTAVRYRGQSAAVSNKDSASADRSRGSLAASGARVLRDRANRRLKGILNSQDQAARILPERLELPLNIFLNADELASVVSDPEEFVMQLEWAYRSLDRLERKTRNRGLPVRFTVQENSGAWTDLQRAAWADAREKVAAWHTRIETIQARQTSSGEWTAELKTTAAGLRADENLYWGVRVEPGAESAWFETAALLVRAASDGAGELSRALSEQRAPRSEFFVPSDALLGMARTFTRSRVSARMLPQSLLGRSVRLFSRLFVRPLGALLSESLEARRTAFQMYSQSA